MRDRAHPLTLEGGRRRLAEVMAKHRQADRQVLPRIPDRLAREGIHAVQGMNPDIALRVPLRILRAFDKRLQLRVETDPAGILQEGETPRWPLA